MTAISAHFLWQDVTRSPTADAQGIDNTLPLELAPNAEAIAAVMEQIRALLGSTPLKVNSWYRCPALNTAIGGSPHSAHMRGLAVDWEPLGGLTNDKAFELVATSAIVFDQLIHERTRSGADWIHVALAEHPPRQQVLAAAGDTLGGPMTFRRVALG